MWGPQRTEKQSGVLTQWVSISVQRGSSYLSILCCRNKPELREREKEKEAKREREREKRGGEREEGQKGGKQGRKDGREGGWKNGVEWEGSKEGRESEESGIN